MSDQFQQYDVVRVVAIRDSRFIGAQVFYERLPRIGDIGTILEIYSKPEVGYEVECSEPSTGFTIWLDAMYPDEIEVVEKSQNEQPQPKIEAGWSEDGGVKLVGWDAGDQQEQGAFSIASSGLFMVNLDRLKRKKQLNVQEQNALSKQQILECANAYLQQSPNVAWVRQALLDSNLSPDHGILLSASAVPCGGDEQAAYGSWLTGEGKFYALEATVRMGSQELIAVDSVQDISASIGLSSHERGTGKSIGALSIEVMSEILKAKPPL